MSKKKKKIQSTVSSLQCLGTVRTVAFSKLTVKGCHCNSEPQEIKILKKKGPQSTHPVPPCLGMSEVSAFTSLIWTSWRGSLRWKVAFSRLTVKDCHCDSEDRRSVLVSWANYCDNQFPIPVPTFKTKSGFSREVVFAKRFTDTAKWMGRGQK